MSSAAEREREESFSCHTPRSFFAFEVGQNTSMAERCVTFDRTSARTIVPSSGRAESDSNLTRRSVFVLSRTASPRACLPRLHKTSRPLSQAHDMTEGEE